VIYHWRARRFAARKNALLRTKMPYSENDALKALSAIKDPLTSGDIISAGRLASLEMEGGILQAVLQIPPPDAEAFFPIREAAQSALEALEDVNRARVILSAHKAGPQMGGRSRANPHQARRPEGVQGDGDVKRIIAISSAKGGVGKCLIQVGLESWFAGRRYSRPQLANDVWDKSAAGARDCRWREEDYCPYPSSRHSNHVDCLFDAR